MHPVVAFDIISLLASLAALFAISKGWGQTFQRSTMFLYAGLLALTIFYSFCLLVEWAGITNALIQ